MVRFIYALLAFFAWGSSSVLADTRTMPTAAELMQSSERSGRFVTFRDLLIAEADAAGVSRPKIVRANSEQVDVITIAWLVDADTSKLAWRVSVKADFIPADPDILMHAARIAVCYLEYEDLRAGAAAGTLSGDAVESCVFSKYKDPRDYVRSLRKSEPGSTRSTSLTDDEIVERLRERFSRYQK
jgi:hypothetical protein